MTFPILAENLRRIMSVHVFFGALPAVAVAFLHAAELVVFVLVAVVTFALNLVGVVTMEEARRALHAVTPVGEGTTYEPVVGCTFRLWAEQVVVVNLRRHTNRTCESSVVAIAGRLAAAVSIVISTFTPETIF
jgi:hypothetical protein